MRSQFNWGMAFLSNHAHFLFRTGDISLSTLMRRFLTGYAVSFNLRHKRHDELFQNRYKSIICQENAYPMLWSWKPSNLKYGNRNGIRVIG
jgi:hypothetical protein